MRNQIVGILVIGIAVLIGFIIYFFYTALGDIVSSACTHGETCPMWGTITFQTNISIGIMVFVVLIGVYLIFFSKEEKIITKIRTIKQKQQIDPKKITKDNYKKALGEMTGEEKKIFEAIIDSGGSMLQSDLVSKTNLNKVKVTRTLDRLEGRNLIERRRRGMSNVVILRH